MIRQTLNADNGGKPSKPGGKPSEPAPWLLDLQSIDLSGEDKPRLAQVSLRIHPGERVALVGPSGAGKSSLIAVANGLIQPDGGSVSWFGTPHPRGRHRHRQRRQRRRQQARIGTLWQDLRLVEQLSVQQNLNTARLAHWGWGKGLLNLLTPLETQACSAVLRHLDLDPALLPQLVSALSGGQRQRVALARLLRQEPLVVLADEPLAHLDPRLTEKLLALLLDYAQAPRALLMSLHRPDLLPGFDRVVGLRAGRLVFDRPASQVGREQLEALYASWL